MIGTVRRFTYGGPEEPGKVGELAAQRHDGQDVLVLRRGASGLFIVETLDGAEFGAFREELAKGATTPATRFPSSG